jgi:hypothetical protein
MENRAAQLAAKTWSSERVDFFIGRLGAQSAILTGRMLEVSLWFLLVALMEP